MASPLFSDPALRRLFGLGTSAYSWLPRDPSDEQRDFYDSSEGAGGLFGTFTDSFRNSAPNLGSILSRHFGDIYNRYKAAAAQDPTLHFDQFLSNYDTKALAHSLNPFERGERPGAFTGRYKTLST